MSPSGSCSFWTRSASSRSEVSHGFDVSAATNARDVSVLVVPKHVDTREDKRAVCRRHAVPLMPCGKGQ